MRDNTEIINGFACITVHPTFIYEGLWNLALLIFIFCYRKKKKFNGELSMLYVAGYGLGRFWIEGLRTDSLMIGPLKVSQVVAVICVLLAVGVIIYNLKLVKKRAEVGDKDLKEEKEPQSGE
jgi:phosphatidylglycerol:prolipoprotein diacylglycerol transferase